MYFVPTLSAWFVDYYSAANKYLDRKMCLTDDYLVQASQWVTFVFSTKNIFTFMKSPENVRLVSLLSINGVKLQRNKLAKHKTDANPIRIVSNKNNIPFPLGIFATLVCIKNILVRRSVDCFKDCSVCTQPLIIQ